MPLYRYSADAPVNQVEIVNLIGRPQAILQLSKTAPVETLKALQEGLHAAGRSVVIGRSETGGDLLIVYGLPEKNPEQFLKELEQKGAVKGKPIKGKSPLDHKKNRMLWLSSIFYTLGNLSDMFSGVIRAKHDGLRKDNIAEFGVGLAFELGDLNMMLFSEGQGLRKMQIFCNELSKTAKENNIPLADRTGFTSNSGFKKKSLTDFCIQNVIRIKSVTESLGGAFKIRSGLGNIGGVVGEDLNPGKIAAGAAILAGWGPSVLVPNISPPDPGDPKTSRNPLDATVDFFQSDVRGRWMRPLAISNNLFSIYGAIKEKSARAKSVQYMEQEVGKVWKGRVGEINKSTLEWAKKRRHDYIPNLFTASFFILAHLLYGASGGKKAKEHSEDAYVERNTILAAANIVLEAPEEQRHFLARRAAKIMRRMVLSNKSVEQLTAVIETAAKEVEQSALWAAHVASMPIATPTPMQEKTSALEDEKTWVAREVKKAVVLDAAPSRA